MERIINHKEWHKLSSIQPPAERIFKYFGSVVAIIIGDTGATLADLEKCLRQIRSPIYLFAEDPKVSKYSRGAIPELPMKDSESTVVKKYILSFGVHFVGRDYIKANFEEGTHDVQQNMDRLAETGFNMYEEATYANDVEKKRWQRFFECNRGKDILELYDKSLFDCINMWTIRDKKFRRARGGSNVKILLKEI